MLRSGKAAGSWPVVSAPTKITTMRNTLTLIPTLMPAMRPRGIDGRTDSAYFCLVAHPDHRWKHYSWRRRDDGAGTRGGLVLARSRSRTAHLRRQLVTAAVDQRGRSSQPPRLIGEFSELRPIDAVKVDHDPAEPAGSELHFENLGPFSDQSELLSNQLLEADGAGSRPEISECVAIDLEGGVPSRVDAVHVQLLDKLEKIVDLRPHLIISPPSLGHCRQHWQCDVPATAQGSGPHNRRAPVRLLPPDHRHGHREPDSGFLLRPGPHLRTR